MFDDHIGGKNVKGSVRKGQRGRVPDNPIAYKAVPLQAGLVGVDPENCSHSRPEGGLLFIGIGHPFREQPKSATAAPIPTWPLSAATWTPSSNRPTPGPG